MDALPCPLCGYDAPARECRHCQLGASDPSLRAGARGLARDALAGLRAVPRGFALLLETRGVKRWLVPPVFLTLLAFAFLYYQLWSLFDVVFEAVRQGSVEDLGLEQGWVRALLAWLIQQGVVLWIANLGQVLFFLLAALLVAVWAFSIVYEALAGPFLDEIQGRIERRWFGVDPRSAIERPTTLPAERCAALSAVAGFPAALLLAFFWIAGGPAAWVALLLVPLPFVVVAALRPEYGKWLGWVLRVESRTLWVSVKAALLAGAILLLFLWVKFVPLVGPPLFFALAGFTVSISLLDIPFSRRQWSLTRRLQFLAQHFVPVVLYGAVSSLLFMVPVVGQIVMVPAASVGGLWLVVRLDKNPLRPPSLRFGRTSLAPEPGA